MGTLVTMEVLSSDAAALDAMDHAFGWFAEIEARCSRFDAASELRQATAQPGFATPLSPMVIEAVRFALTVAEATSGAFDPTLGRAMEKRGFARHYRTADAVASGEPDRDATWRDVELDPHARTMLLRRPLTLDLGAVAKGMAVDAAARELSPFRDFAIDAGGDLYLGGCNRRGAPWTVGIPHPRIRGELIASLSVTNCAVCTSGDYERTAAQPGEHHILDPRTGVTPRALASVTVIAPTAMLADALATAAFVLGPDEGLALLEREGVEGLIVTSEMQLLRTETFSHAA